MKMKGYALKVLLGLAAAFVLLESPAPAPTMPGMVVGYVTNAGTGMPIAGATVTLAGTASGTVIKTTNNDGLYLYSGAPAFITASATATNYVGSGSITVNLLEGSQVTQHFPLVSTLPTPTPTSTPTTTFLTWRTVGAGDFNGDNKPDIVWRNSTTGEVMISLMDGRYNVGSAQVGSAPLEWVIVGIGDFNIDNHPDILWQNTTTGQVVVWYMTGVVQTGFDSIGFGPVEWAVTGVGDLTADGKPDILWTNISTGQVGLWIMNGVIQTGYVEMSGTPL